MTALKVWIWFIWLTENIRIQIESAENIPN